jgi:hypothetical protein
MTRDGLTNPLSLLVPMAGKSTMASGLLQEALAVTEFINADARASGGA